MAQSAAWHRVLHGTECCMAQSAAWHRVLHGTECCMAQSAAWHRVLHGTECCMAQSAAWHSSGVKGPLALDAPVGIPLSEILDHLVLARAAGRGVLVGSWKACEIMLLMWGAAACSVEREEGGGSSDDKVSLGCPVCGSHLCHRGGDCREFGV